RPSPSFRSLPHQKYVLSLPPRQAYSHSASVGRRYSIPSGNLPADFSFCVNHSQNAFPSFQLTQTTGYTSRNGKPKLGSLQLFPSIEIQGCGGAFAVISQLGS